jgi:hypothetical protein
MGVQRLMIRIPKKIDEPRMLLTANGFDIEQPVVLGDALSAAGRTGLDLSASHGHGEISHEGVFGFARAVGDDIPPASRKFG